MKLSGLTCLALVAAASLAPAYPTLTLDLVTNHPVPVAITRAPGDSTRLYTIEKTNGTTGRIRVVQNGALLATPALIVSGLASTSGEQGLLGLAFHPQFQTNRYLYVNFTRTDRATVIRRYTMTSNPNVVDTASGLDLLIIPQPFTNHNGGTLRFDADGYLVIGMGDGGSGNDPQNYSQTLTSLLGKMLRIDVNRDDFPADPNRNYGIPSDNPFATIGGAPEIRDWGVRNPWKWHFDEVADNGFGGMIMADVGQSQREEINYAAPGLIGLNYGWRVFEGTRSTGLGGGTGPYVAPIWEYTHDNGCSITGGTIYRGTDLGPDFWGHYFYGDWCDAWIEALPLTFNLETGAATAGTPFRTNITQNGITAMEPDANNELFTMSTLTATMRRVGTANPFPSVAGTIDLEDVVQANQPLGVNVTYINNQTGMIKTLQVGLPSEGHYKIPAYRASSTMRVRVGTWLSQSVQIDTVLQSLSGINFSLKNGDVNEDNEIGPADFALLSNAFGTEFGEPGYLRNADLNRDNEVGPADFSILSNNFGEEGT